MLREYIIKTLLLPFSLIYGLIISLRDLLYRLNIVRSVSFNVPVIGVGNLAVGGSGKTPHVSYLIEQLRPYLRVGVMSRGYKRKTKGYRIANPTDTALTIGDEPYQLYLKYPDIDVAVSESRSIGIPYLLSNRPDLQAIILDDSYQHLSVSPGLNILITDYAKPYYDDFLLPTGRLREWKNGADRADLIIVSKCPNNLSENEQSNILGKLKPTSNQSVFFSKYRYGQPYHIFSGHRVSLADYDSALLITAIASTDYLMEYLQIEIDNIHPLSFEDHHLFSAHEISTMSQIYNELPTNKKIILTTEKDATRIALHHPYLTENGIDIYALPIQVQFLDDTEELFNETVRRFLLNFAS